MKEYTNSQIGSLIDEHIHNERNRSILKRRLCDGITYEKIGEEYDLSTQRIKAIIYKAEQTLIRYL